MLPLSVLRRIVMCRSWFRFGIRTSREARSESSPVGRRERGKLLERAGRFSLCVQTETLPHKYVSVEGPIVAVEAADLERDRRPLARRYLGTELGDRYIESTRDLVGGVLVRMRPERWLTVDYAKHAEWQANHEAIRRAFVERI